MIINTRHKFGESMINVDDPTMKSVIGNVSFEKFEEGMKCLKRKYDIVSLSEAEILFGESITNMKNEHHVVFLARAVCHFHLRNRAKAIEDYSNCIRCDSNPNFLYFVLRGSLLYLLQRYEEAEGDFKKAFELVLKSTDSQNRELDMLEILKERVKCLKLLKRNRECVEVYKVMKKLKPDDCEVYFGIAGLYHSIGEFSLALLAYTDFISILEKTTTLPGRAVRLASSYCSRSMCFLTLGKFSEAEADQNKCVEIAESQIELISRIPFYTQRGQFYNQIKKYELAIRDFSTSIEMIEDKNIEWRQNPMLSNSQVYVYRGQAFIKKKKFDEAEKDFLTVLDADLTLNGIDYGCTHSVPIAHCGMAELWFERGDVQKSEEFFKRALDTVCFSKNQPWTKQREMNVMVLCLRKRFDIQKKYDFERALDDYARIGRLVEHYSGVELNNKLFLRKEVETIMKGLGNMEKGGEEYGKLQFVEDKGVDEEFEKGRMEELSEVLEKKVMNQGTALRLLGRGKFGRTYLYVVEGVRGVYVLKVLTGLFMEEKDKKIELMEKEGLEFPYHRNLVTILSSQFVQNIPVNKYPDYEKYWELREIEYHRSGTILMPYYRKDLEKFVRQRFDLKRPFDDFEICLMMKGLILGVHHLMSNLIVHRDLHIGNIFVDEGYGRIYIGDFGCALDLRSNEHGFIVEKTDDIMFTSGYYLNKGGSVTFLPPEILEFGGGDYLDYSKSDIFSIGVLSYLLVSSFTEHRGLDPFGKVLFSSLRSEEESDDKEEVRERTDEFYVDLKMIEPGVNEEISSLVSHLLSSDLDERITSEKAVEKITEILQSVKLEIGEQVGEEEEEDGDELKAVPENLGERRKKAIHLETVVTTKEGKGVQEEKNIIVEKEVVLNMEEEETSKDERDLGDIYTELTKDLETEERGMVDRLTLPLRNAYDQMGKTEEMLRTQFKNNPTVLGVVLKNIIPQKKALLERMVLMIEDFVSKRKGR